MNALTNILGRFTSKPVREINNAPVQGFSSGVAGTEIYGGYIEEEALQELRGTKGADTFNKMRRSDGNITMILRAVKLPIRSAQWSLGIKEGFQENPIAKKQQELFSHILFNDLGKPWTRFTGEALTFVDFGYALFEKTYKPVVNHSKFGSYIGIKSLGFRSQRTVERWGVDSNGHLLGIEQQCYGDTGRIVDIPAQHLIHFCPDQEGDNFEGMSYLRPCYGSYFRKNLFLKLLAAGLEKYLIPIPILTVPIGKENSIEYENALKVLRAYTSNQTNYITKPAGWDIDIKTTTVDAEKVRSIIKDENQEMVNSVLAGFLLLGQTNTGSHALGSTLGDFFGTAVQFLGDHICEVLNDGLLTDLCKLNFGDQELMVKLKVEGIKDSASNIFAEVIQKLITSGAIKPDVELEKFVREKFKLPVAKQALEIKPTIPAPGDASPVPATEDVQKTAFNGAQVASLLQIVQSVAAGTLPRSSGVEMIVTAFQVDIAEAERLIGESGNSFKIEAKPGETAPLALSEAKPRQDQLIRRGANELRSYIDAALTFIGVQYIEKIRSAYQGSTPQQRLKIPNQLELTVPSEYQEILTVLSMMQAYDAVAPIKKRMTLATSTAEKIAKVEAMTAQLFDAIDRYERSRDGKDALEIGYLQRSIKQRMVGIKKDLDLSSKNIASIKSRVETMTTTQVADLKKKIDLQYQSSIGSTDSERTLIGDLETSRINFQSSPVINTGPDILASQNVNESILQETEDEPSVESYTFVAVDDDATTDICRELNGRTFGKDDPDLFRLHPPLHHNCRSYMAVNLVSFKGNPAISTEPLELTKGAQGDITLSEQTYVSVFGKRRDFQKSKKGDRI